MEHCRAIDNQPLLNNITYEPFGPINGWTWANGTNYKRTYDPNGRITKTTLPDLPAAYHNFDYDNLNRLTRAEAIGGDLMLYTYDATGNRTAKTTNGEQHIYANDKQSNRLLRVEVLMKYQVSDRNQFFKRSKCRAVAHGRSGAPISTSASRISPIPTPSALSGFSPSSHQAHITLITGTIKVESPATPVGNTRRMNNHKAQASAVASMAL